MLNLKHVLSTSALLCLLGALPLSAADDKEESLWGYADPAADVNIYINTKQAEKAMSKDLWEQGIQKINDPSKLAFFPASEQLAENLRKTQIFQEMALLKFSFHFI